jgi:hypothetical protein
MSERKKESIIIEEDFQLWHAQPSLKWRCKSPGTCSFMWEEVQTFFEIKLVATGLHFKIKKTVLNWNAQYSTVENISLFAARANCVLPYILHKEFLFLRKPATLDGS